VEVTSGASLRTRVPGAGFVLLCASALFTAAFFLWGAGEPELDRVWRLLHELKIGKRERLRGADLRLLRETLARYPDLGPSLLDNEPAGLVSANTGGWVETRRAYILVQPGAGSDPVVTFHWRPDPDRPQGPMVLLGGGKPVAALKGPGSVTLGLSKAMRATGLIEVRLDVQDEKDGLATGLQIVFGEAD
jgi:hypothetical protein